MMGKFETQKLEKDIRSKMNKENQKKLVEGIFKGFAAVGYVLSFWIILTVYLMGLWLLMFTGLKTGLLFFSILMSSYAIMIFMFFAFPTIQTIIQLLNNEK